jgi:hypothetical protein
MRRRQPHWFALAVVRIIMGILGHFFPDPRQFLGRARQPAAGVDTISDCSEGSIMPECTPTKIKIARRCELNHPIISNIARP